MDIVIFTGRVSLEEFQRERPAEYQELVEKGELESHLADPLSPTMVRIVRLLAWTVLFAGIIIIAGILYTMLFLH